MIAIIHVATGAVERVAVTLDGLDMTGRTAVETPQDYDPIAVSHVWLGGEWVRNVDAALARLRSERNARLSACDWTQMRDQRPEVSDLWAPYRQALKDMPETADPFAPEWPVPPV